MKLELPTWGGKREGAGRPPKGAKAGVPHRSRIVDRSRPLHVTVRVRNDVPNLRRHGTWKLLRATFRRGCDRFGFRLAQYSVQGNHLHLIVEADDAVALGRGMKGLSIRLARVVNRLRRRGGPVLADRYHAHVLTTPTEVRNALLYVLDNARVHGRRSGRGVEFGSHDPYSTAGWFTGWRQNLVRPVDIARKPSDDPPVAKPATWLLRVGWRRHGLL